MKPAEIQIKINVARRELQYWEGVLKDKNCRSCSHFDGCLCKKYNAEPPADVVAAGCDEWEWDEIPF